MTLATWLLLTLISALTSAISALTGMGGGVLLFSAMSFFLPLDTLIPLHGVVQLGSNSSRVLLLRKFIYWKFFLPFFLTGFLGALVAVFLKKTISISPAYSYLGISILIFYVLFKPKKMPSFSIGIWGFALIGLIAGFLGIFIGTVGPFLAVFFVRGDLEKEQIIATKAIMQTYIHILKLPGFLFLGFDYFEYTYPVIFMVLMSFIGTSIGVKLLMRLSFKWFFYLFKGSLFVAMIRLLWRSVSIGLG